MGFYIFIIVLIVIWTLSGIATWVNKQKEAERRRMIRLQMGQPRGAPGLPPMRQTSRGPQRPPARTISRGIADRFPDVLLPPAPVSPSPRHVPPHQAPMRLPGQPRFAAKRPRSRPVPQPPPPPLVRAEQAPRPPIASEAAQSPTATAPRSPRITADTISRWLKPQTLNQQFILTEIFQAPLAMREPRF